MDLAAIEARLREADGPHLDDIPGRTDRSPDYPAMARVVAEMIAAAHAAGVAQERERLDALLADQEQMVTILRAVCYDGLIDWHKRGRDLAAALRAAAIRAGEGAGACSARRAAAMSPKMVRVPDATEAEAALVRIRGAIRTDRYPGDPDHTPSTDFPIIRAALAAGVAQERERAAQLVEKPLGGPCGPNCVADLCRFMRTIAAAIRAGEGAGA